MQQQAQKNDEKRKRMFKKIMKQIKQLSQGSSERRHGHYRRAVAVNEEIVIIAEAVVAATEGISDLRLVGVTATNGEGGAVANLPRCG